MDEKREKSCLIVSGGPLETEFAAKFLAKRTYDYVIAADAGLTACMTLGVRPDLLVGDFDTYGRERAEAFIRESGIPAEIHRPEKDETDTELAFSAAAVCGCTRADVLGATGGRLDHELSNIHLLLQAEKLGLSAALYDSRNKLSLLDAAYERKRIFFRDRLYGKYVSFIPLTEQVTGITLTGFRYSLADRTISIWNDAGLCISNEVVSEQAVLEIKSGILICVEAHD